MHLRPPSIDNFKENLDYFSNHGSIFIIRYLNSNKIKNLFNDKGIINDSMEVLLEIIVKP